MVTQKPLESEVSSVNVAMSKTTREGWMKDQKKSSLFQIALEKRDFSFGEMMKLNISCNNSESKFALKKIKFKLYLGFKQFKVS